MMRSEYLLSERNSKSTESGGSEYSMDFLENVILKNAPIVIAIF